LGLALAGLALAARAESTVEIAYDDGIEEAARGYGQAASGFAVRFTPAQPGDMLLSVRIYVAGLVGEPAPIEIHVWDGEKKDLIPSILAAPSAAGWFDVDVSSAQLVLTDDIYVGYVQTSGENYPWMGVDTTTAGTRSFSLPEWSALLPEGACAMIRILTQRALAADDGLELAYDDGTAEASRGYAMAGAGYAVRFTPPAGGATLESVRLYVAGIQGSPAPIEIHVWDLDGRDLLPPIDALPEAAGWFEIDLASLAVRFTADFRVGYLQTDGENYPWLGIDQGTPTGRSTSVPDGNELLPRGANAMIRVRFAGT